MMYYTFSVGEKDYKLRLSTRNTIALEKKIGCNPLMIFGNGDKVPSITEMVAVLSCSLEQLNHGLTANDAYDIFDRWLEEGNATTDFIPIILEIYKASGIIREEQNEKN